MYTPEYLKKSGPCGIVANAEGEYIALFKDYKEAQHYAYNVWRDEGCAAGKVDENGNVEF